METITFRPEILAEELRKVDSSIDACVASSVFTIDQSVIMKRLARSNGAESVIHAQQIVSTAREALVDQFNAYAHEDGGLAKLKANDPEYFARLWKVVHGKLPSQ